MKNTIIYLHGFLGVGNGDKAEAMRQGLPGIPVLAPALTFDPDENIAIVESLIESIGAHSIILVGTSLGGFWANYFAQKHKLPCIIVNPCVSPAQSFENRCGDHQKYETDEVVTVTKEALSRYATLEAEAMAEFDGALVNLLVAKDDDVLPYLPTLSYFGKCKSIQITETGGHRFGSEWHRVIEILKDKNSESYHSSVI